jgi:hypothetical protein
MFFCLLIRRGGAVTLPIHFIRVVVAAAVVVVVTVVVVVCQ